MNFGKTESLDTPKSVGEKKMRRGEGGGASGQKWHTKGKWLVSSQFFKFFLEKRFALFEKFEKKGC